MSEFKQLYISYNDYEKEKSSLKQCCKTLDNTVESYYGLLHKTNQEAIISGSVADALVTYMNYVASLKGMAYKIYKQYAKMVKNFLNRIDIEDDFLYDKKTDKDFSEQAYEMFDEVTIHRKETGNWWKDHISDAGRFFLEDVFGIYFLDDYDANMYLTKEEMKKLAKTESRRIKDIFEMVHETDNEYKGKCENHLIKTFESYRKMFENIQHFLVSKETFTVDNINANLSQIFQELMGNLAALVAVDDVSDESIKNFVKQMWAAMYFDSFQKAINQYLSDIGTVEEVNAIVYNAFGIVEGDIKYGDYEKHIIKSELLETLDSLSENYVYSTSDEKAAIDEFDSFINMIKGKGTSITEWLHEHRDKNGKLLLDKRTRQYKDIAEFLNSLGNADKILDYGSQGIDFLSRLFTDYDKSLKIINSFSKNANLDQKTKECVEEITLLYKKDLNAWINEFGEKVADNLTDIGVGALSNAIPVVNVVGKIKEGIDEFGEITGSGTRAKSMLNAMIYQDTYYSSKSAYESALKKFQNAKEGDENYDQLLIDLKNCFAFCKKNLMNMLSEMANSVQGSKKAYYQYCLTVASKASLSDTSKLVVLSYDDYMNYGV